MIFVDSGAWFASAVTEDRNHAAASRWLTRNREQLVTSDYVVDETLTLLRARRQPGAALTLGRRFFEGSITTVCYLTEAQMRLAWAVFEAFSDKEWSFTDCTSKVLMEELEIQSAFAFDQHFRQFGGMRVVP